MSLIFEDEDSDDYRYDHHSALETQMLFTGYIRENYVGYVPIVLIRICCQYFEHIFYWTLRGEQLQTFLNAKSGANVRMDSKILPWTPVTFQLHLFPNKSYLIEDGYVGFCWRIIQCPEWIKKLHIVYKMYCIDSFAIAKDRIILDNDNQISSVGHGWDLNVMKLPENYPLKSITFACFIQCKFNEDAKDDWNTLKQNQNVLFPNDGYRKLLDKMNYKIQ